MFDELFRLGLMGSGGNVRSKLGPLFELDDVATSKTKAGYKMNIKIVCILPFSFCLIF